MSTPTALVLAGDGLNCERETAAALRQAGASTRIRHLSDLAGEAGPLAGVQILALPGGFSFGDEIGSGRILALKIGRMLGPSLGAFLQRGGLLIGICNGFQTLVHLGLLPGSNHPPATLTANHPPAGEPAGFINRWETLQVGSSRCIWTHGLEGEAAMPIRHGEGRLTFGLNEADTRDVVAGLEADGLVALRYARNVNGSDGRIAGLTDPTGQVLGLMPHPEAATLLDLNPAGDSAGDSAGDNGAFGAALFQNAVAYARTHLTEAS